MSVVRKLLLRPGVHHAPQGVLEAPPKRVRNWARTFKEMKKAGLRIPCCWGHQPGAVPADASDDARAERQYYLSRYNAGYLEDLVADGAANLDAVLDVPGCSLEGDKLVAWTRLPDGREVKTAVGEVSAAIRDWTDGTGRLWKDAIIHVALTPLPVVGNQTGFRSLSSVPDTQTFYLSLSTLEADMADDILDTPAPGEGSGDFFSQVLMGLARRGIRLPDDTTPENAWERLAVALHALDGTEPDGDELALPEEPGEEEEGETFPEEAGAGMGPGEEPRPVMMSLSTARTPVERKLIARHQEAHKARQRKKIDALVRRGLPAHRASEMRALVDGYQLSMTEDGTIRAQGIDRDLALLDEVLPKRAFTRSYLAAHGRHEVRPDDSASPEDKDEIARRAAAVSRVR